MKVKSAKKRTTRKAKEEPIVEGKRRPILVRLPHAPSVVVNARDTSEAVKLYRRVVKIVSTDHSFKFSRPGPDIETDANGVVIEERQKGRRTRKPADEIDEDWDIERDVADNYDPEGDEDDDDEEDEEDDD